MAVSTEKRLRKLEDELKALKATYNISGGLVKTYRSSSPTYNLPDELIRVRIKFTPTYTSDQRILVSSVFVEVINEYGSIFNFSPYAYCEIQSGDGSVVISVPGIGGTVRVEVASTSPGTFTRLQ